jgi:hypothetical protein
MRFTGVAASSAQFFIFAIEQHEKAPTKAMLQARSSNLKLSGRSMISYPLRTNLVFLPFRAAMAIPAAISSMSATTVRVACIVFVAWGIRSDICYILIYG